VPRLTTHFFQRALDGLIEPGRYRDGGGLILNVTPNGASWLLRYSLEGRRRDLGLGKAAFVGLARARDMAVAHLRDIKSQRSDPIAARRKAKEAKAAEVPFAEFAEQWIAERVLPTDRKRGVQWLSSLRTYAFPVMGQTPMSEVTRAQVLSAVEPIWATKHETARRVRQRIERIIDVAIARGLREASNPARGRDLKASLDMPRPKAMHHPALAWRQVPAFYRQLAKQPGNGARALQFAILTAARSNEALGCQWSEIDGKAKTWTLPPDRMKTRKAHKVPLSRPALTLVKAMPRTTPFVFAGAKAGRPLSNMAMQMVLRRMGRTDITPHGFRSSFRDFCADTGKPRELAEAALAHMTASGTERAYFRSDLIEQRGQLMQAWARFVCGR
jgi:integrase